MTVLRKRVTIRDDTAPHQIRLTLHRPDDHAPGPHTDLIAVSCTCQAIPGTHNATGPAYRPLAARDRWDNPDDYWAIWHQHMAEVAAS